MRASISVRDRIFLYCKNRNHVKYQIKTEHKKHYTIPLNVPKNERHLKDRQIALPRLAFVTKRERGREKEKNAGTQTPSQ